MSKPIPAYLGPSTPDITLSGEDGAKLDVGAGGKLGSAAFIDVSELPSTNARVMAKAWVNFGDDGRVTVNKSYNVSNVTRNNDGDYTIVFDPPMDDENYVALINARGDGKVLLGTEFFESPTRTTTEYRILTADVVDAKGQVAKVCSVLVFN